MKSLLLSTHLRIYITANVPIVEDIGLLHLIFRFKKQSIREVVNASENFGNTIYK